MNVHVFCVFIDWSGSHLSLTLVLNRGLGRAGRAGSHGGFSDPRWVSDVGGLERVDRLLAEAPQISLLKSNESPPLIPFSESDCRNVHRRTHVTLRVLLAELCPLSEDHLLWAYSVPECVGIKRGT